MKWHKYFSEVFNTEHAGKYTLSKRKLYFKRGDIFVQLNSKKDIVQLFDNNESEVKKLLRKKKIKILKTEVSKLYNFFNLLDVAMPR